MTATAHTGLDPEFNEITETLRGRTFVLREISAADFKKIQDQCLDKIEQLDGSVVERYDNAREQALMLAKSVVSAEPALPEGGVLGLGTRIYVALNVLCRQLHFGEPDEKTGVASALETERAKTKSKDGAKGKG